MRFVECAVSFFDHRLLQHITERPMPARRIDNLWRDRSAHRIRIAIAPGASVSNSLRAITGWIEDVANEARGFYSIDYRAFDHCFEVYLTDSNTAYWFGKRWNTSA